MLYRVVSNGIHMGDFGGATRGEAIDRYARYAGYEDYAQLADVVGQTVTEALSEVDITPLASECAYCGRHLPCEQYPPKLDDDDAWATSATAHAADCEWIATRGHQRDA